MEHQDDLVAQANLAPQRKEIAALFGVGVTLRTGVLELIRIAHTNQIAGDQPTHSFAIRHDVAPKVRRGRVTVLENNCIAAAVLDIGHPLAFDGGECLLSIGLCRDRHRLVRVVLIGWRRGHTKGNVGMPQRQGATTLDRAQELVKVFDIYAKVNC